ncbi:MAG: SHOCT domain-containing protein [Candidatus Dormibacteria bacterium]
MEQDPLSNNNNGCCARSGCVWLLIVGLFVYAWESTPLWADVLITIGLVALIGVGLYYKLSPNAPLFNRSGSRTTPPQAHVDSTGLLATGGPRHEAAVSSEPTAMSSAPTVSIVDQIKRLAELRDAGILTEAEFEAKKTELLDRI